MMLASRRARGSDAIEVVVLAVVVPIPLSSRVHLSSGCERFREVVADGRPRSASRSGRGHVPPVDEGLRQEAALEHAERGSVRKLQGGLNPLELVELGTRRGVSLGETTKGWCITIRVEGTSWFRGGSRGVPGRR